MTMRIAVPNKGALSQAATEMLRESGYRQRQDAKELATVDVENDVEFFYLRPRDIATYVGSGALDVGITGRDLLLDSHSGATEVDVLYFGSSTFRFAGPPDRFGGLPDLEGVRVAMVHDSGPRAGRPRRMRALFPDADLVVYGHSHLPDDSGGLDGQRLFNPGSCTQRRRAPTRTYGVLDLDSGLVRRHRIVDVA